jgi:two-component system sensor histidine kinase UhpB
VQESLTNVIRHARANHVGIELRETDGNAPGEHANGGPRLRLTVRDDGCGIDPAMPPGFGLRGMQERVQGLGGSYKVESARGRGTCVRIAIPIAVPRPEHP